MSRETVTVTYEVDRWPFVITFVLGVLFGTVTSLPYAFGSGLVAATAAILAVVVFRTARTALDESVRVTVSAGEPPACKN